VAEFLLEIGCEEIPASWLDGTAKQLGERFVEIASREVLDPRDLRLAWAPRRLVVSAELSLRQADQEQVVWGPSLKAARDASGQWTNAATGFARKNGVVPEQLQMAAKNPAAPLEQNLQFVKKTSGRPTPEVLPAVIPAVLRALAFPKRMNWDAWLDDGKGSFPFGRPIRWIVALFGGEVVPFTIFTAEAGSRGAVLVRASDTTRGHRFLPRGAAGRPIRVASFSDLQDKLRSAFVLMDPAARGARIRSGLAAASAFADGLGITAEWDNLVEYPTVVSGSIPEEFQALPREVLETVLVHHQKYLPVVSNGAVVRFAAVTNTDGSAAAEMTRGMERVVVARLRDGRFFFEEDRKRPLADRLPDLAGVTFHQKLGTYREKAQRLVRLVDAFQEMGLLSGEPHGAARQAALLCKADLTTLMVREFTELQGVMGALYLEAEAAPPAVAAAVRWHYHPVSLEVGSAPAGELTGDALAAFAAVSLADKLDTLAGYFGIGQAPTGSSDPYGLRRAGQGAVRVLLDFWPAAGSVRPSLRRLAAAAVSGYTPARATQAVVSDLEGFLIERLRHVLAARGFPADEIEAVLGAREPDALDDVGEALARARCLHAVRSEARADFEALAVAFKRARNILGETAPAEVQAALLSEEAERQLHAAVVKLSGAAGSYDERLRALATLRGPVDRFFDDVLVMADDPRLRANRLGLLSQTLSLFYRIADISKLGGQS
jgi:glycyl-tRNA synthetase beta chain